MPSISLSDTWTQFFNYASVGSRNDDFNKLQMINKSFNAVHDSVRKSMDLNFILIDLHIAKLEWALEELAKQEAEIDVEELIKVVKDDVKAKFGKFDRLYKANQRKVETRRSDFLSEISPIQAYSYEHYVNDEQKGEVDGIIATHLYREGLFDIADGFVNECEDVELKDKMGELRLQFKNLEDIVSALRICEIQLPLQWVSEHRESLGETTASELEFKIHAIKLLSMIDIATPGTGGVHEAVIYTRTHLTPLTLVNECNRNDLTLLMCCLLYLRQSHQIRLDANSPCFHVFDGSYKRDLIGDIERQFYVMMGQCIADPLRLVTSVGAKFLSGVCKAAGIVKKELERGWTQLGQVPLIVNLDEELKFHSYFICPVTELAMSNGFNPPLAYECGHVVSFQYMLDWMSSWLTETMYCPFCHKYYSKVDYKTVYF